MQHRWGSDKCTHILTGNSHEKKSLWGHTHAYLLKLNFYALSIFILLHIWRRGAYMENSVVKF
jgi:hypothetical protein